MSTELALIDTEKLNLPAIFASPESVDPILKAIEEKVSGFVPDTTTQKGRDLIASMAHKVARSKVALDDAGKKLVADIKQQVSLVDDSRKHARDYLDALKDRVRKPLTEWEEAEERRLAEEQAERERAAAAEKARVDNCRALIRHIIGVGNGIIGDQVQPIGLLERELEEKITLPEWLGEFADEARSALVMAKDRVAAMRQKAAQDAADQAERERLAAENEALRKREQERLDREAAEQRERERIANEERIRQEAAAKAVQEAEDREREKARQAEQERLRQEQERLLNEQKAADEARRKSEDEQHRATINREALADLVALGLPEQTSRQLIGAIIKGAIRNVSIKY